MIVISLILVIAAAVSLFIGLFVVTETLTFIWGAIGLCLVSLLLLWLGTRQRKGAGPTTPSAPVYGGAARAGVSTTPARTATGDDLDDLTAPDSGAVVRKTTARDRAATRLAGDGAAAEAEQTPVDAATADVAAGEEVVKARTATSAAAAPTSDTPPVEKVTKKATTKKSTKKATATRVTKKAATKKSTKKAATKKAATKKAATKKAATKKAAAKKSTKKAASKKAATKKATAGTRGAAARARLAQIAGVGPAKQDALLSQFGSLEGIRDASVDDIGNVRGFGEALATRVKNELS